MYYGPQEWLSTQASDLAGYVLELSHHDTATKLPVIGSCLTAVLQEQGESPPDLFELARLVAVFKRSLLDHYAGPEGELLVRLASATENSGAPSAAVEAGDAGAGIGPGEMRAWSQAVAEHPPLLELLDEIRRVTFDFSLPPGTEGGEPDTAHIKDLYDRLRDLEIDVRRHIYIEEQLLVPLLEKEFA